MVSPSFYERLLKHISGGCRFSCFFEIQFRRAGLPLSLRVAASAGFFIATLIAVHTVVADAVRYFCSAHFSLLGLWLSPLVSQIVKGRLAVG
jgi:hypothetical protein